MLEVHVLTVYENYEILSMDGYEEAYIGDIVLNQLIPAILEPCLLNESKRSVHDLECPINIINSFGKN